MAKNFNLIQIGNKWHYRRRVPTDLLAAFNGKVVIKYSLKTSDMKQARACRDIEEVRWNEKFKKLRSGLTSETQLPLQTLSDEEVKELIRGHVERALKRFTSSVENNPPNDADERRDMVEEQELVLQNLKAESHHAHEWISSAWTKLEAEAVAQKSAINANPPVISYLQRALIEISNFKLNLLNHDYGKLHSDPAFGSQMPAMHKFIQLADAYIKKYKEAAALNSRTQKAIDKVVQNVSLIVELVGPNFYVASFDYDALESTRFKLARVPTNYKKLFKGKSLDDAIFLGAETKAKTLSHKSQTQYLGALQQILKLAVAKKWLASLPAADFKPVTEAKVKEKDKKRAFTVSQLKGFFVGPFYGSAANGDKAVLAKADFEWRFWLPIVALFSGMRGNEISLLLTTDIQKTENGISYFNVTDVGDASGKGVLAKSVKTVTSIRKIPIHDSIIELGFLDFVARRRSESGNARLFDTLKPDKYGNLFAYAGRRFNENFLPREMGSLERQSFHSFRHTFRNALRQMSMAETKCARWRRKSVPVWLIKKGGDARGSVCLV